MNEINGFGLQSKLISEANVALKEGFVNLPPAAVRARTCPTSEDDFRVSSVRCERLVDGVRLHVQATSRDVEEAAHREQRSWEPPVIKSRGSLPPNTTALCGVRSHSTPSRSVGKRISRP